MQLKKINLNNWHVHRHTEVEFPKTGVVLITGDNGSGKSLLVEAISVALWGKSLRGESMFTDAQTTIGVEFENPSLTVERGVDSAGKKFVRVPSVKTQFDTTSKAQTVITSVAGEQLAWRNTHVFSSSDVVKFSVATDVEKKLLLESCIGLERFDVALQAAKKDLNELTSTLAVMTAQRQSVSDRYTTLVEQLETLQPPTEVHEPTLDNQLFSNLTDYESQLPTLKETAVMRQAERLAVDNELLATKRQLKNTSCATCGRPLVDAVEQYETTLKKKISELEFNAKDSAYASVIAWDVFRDSESRVQQLRRKVAEYEKDVALFEQTKATLRTLDSTKNRLLNSIGEHDDALCSLDTTLDSGTFEREALEKVTELLSPRGVRSFALNRFLTSLEAHTNLWLQRLCNEIKLSVAISSQTERGNGSVVNSIQFLVTRNGVQLPYGVLSDGERRRVDISTVLALSSIVHSTNTPGTIFFDEVFDRLDTHGIVAVCEVLREQAKTRCVVVIAHNTEMFEQLKGCQRWHVEKGTVRQ